MIRKSIFVAFLVLVLPLTAVAVSRVASSAVNIITAMPEPSTLGLLGTGLIGFAVMIRRKMKLAVRGD